MSVLPDTSGRVERFRIVPGAVTAVPVFGGDRLDVVDPYGRQPAELTVLSGDPRALADARPDSAATVLRRLVPGPDEDGYAAGRILTLLSRHRIDQQAALATRLFGDHSPAGSRASFAVEADAHALVAAPAAPMSLFGAEPNPPSEVWVEIHRADTRRPERHELPEPLAEPLWDHIDAATASSYERKNTRAMTSLSSCAVNAQSRR